MVKNAHIQASSQFLPGPIIWIIICYGINRSTIAYITKTLQNTGYFFKLRETAEMFQKTPKPDISFS
jgi:hypothetical protein